MQTRRPNYTHEFIGAEYRDELKFKPDPSIRAFIGKGDYSVILDGGSYPGTNHAANVAFKKIGEKERKSVSNGFYGVKNWIHSKTGKTLFELWEKKCFEMGYK